MDGRMVTGVAEKATPGSLAATEGLTTPSDPLHRKGGLIVSLSVPARERASNRQILCPDCSEPLRMTYWGPSGSGGVCRPEMYPNVPDDDLGMHTWPGDA